MESYTDAAKEEALETAQEYTDAAVGAAMTGITSGLTFRGAVNTAADLPADAAEGDVYIGVYGNGTGEGITNSVYAKAGGVWRNLSTENPIGLYNRDDGKYYGLTLCVENGHVVWQMKQT